MRRYVCHLDADCFYCSCERVRFKWMLGKPLGVLGNQGVAVIAKSYEMRSLGIKTGEAIWDARMKCPDGILVKRDFRWYVERLVEELNWRWCLTLNLRPARAGTGFE